MNTRYYECANDNGDDSAVNYNGGRDDDVDDNEIVDDDEDSGGDCPLIDCSYAVYNNNGRFAT